MIASLIKMLLVVLGTLSTIWFLIAGLRGKEGAYKKLGFSVIGTFLLLSIISVIEQRMYTDNLKNQPLKLSAGREAPVGMILLKLYANNHYTLTYDERSESIKGTYKIENDTLSLFNADTVKATFSINEKSLKEISSTGIGGLQILEKH